MPVFPSMQFLWRSSKTKKWRLLCILQLWYGEMSAAAVLLNMNSLKLKIPPVIVFALVALIMYLIAERFEQGLIEIPFRKIILYFLFGTGALFGLVGVIQFIKNKTTVNPHSLTNTNVLVTSGFYSISRNPMYLGLLLLLLCFGVYLQNYFILIGVIIFILYMNEFQIKPEEEFLNEKFGEEYEKYKTNVRRWI